MIFFILFCQYQFNQSVRPLSPAVVTSTEMIVCLGRRVISGAGVNPFAIKLISSHRRQHIPRTFYPFVSPSCARSFSIPKGTQQKKDNEESKPKIPNQSIWEQLKSPPNVITLTRMASTPILAHLIVSEEYTLAIGGCILAGLSDALDGFLAKNYKMETIVGRYPSRFTPVNHTLHLKF